MDELTYAYVTGENAEESWLELHKQMPTVLPTSI
jgi:hypothetical protein